MHCLNWIIYRLFSCNFTLTRSVLIFVLKCKYKNALLILKTNIFKKNVDKINIPFQPDK